MPDINSEIAESAGKALQAQRKKTLKICPCGHQRITYATTSDLCSRCNRNARQQAFRDRRKAGSCGGQLSNEPLNVE